RTVLPHLGRGSAPGNLHAAVALIELQLMAARPRFRFSRSCSRAVRQTVLAIALAFAAIPASTAELRWPESVPPLARAWHPQHKQICQQNPPDFSWPAVPGA